MQTEILTYKIILTAALVSASIIGTMGQTRLQVITKTIEKSFTASSYNNVKIEG